MEQIFFNSFLMFTIATGMWVVMFMFVIFGVGALAYKLQNKTDDLVQKGFASLKKATLDSAFYSRSDREAAGLVLGVNQKAFSFSGTYIAADRFFSLLIERFGKIDVNFVQQTIQENTNMWGKSFTMQVNANGSFIILSGSISEENYEAPHPAEPGQARYASKNATFDLASFKDANGYVKMIGNLKLYIPTTDTEIKIDLIKSVIEDSEVEAKKIVFKSISNRLIGTEIGYSQQQGLMFVNRNLYDARLGQIGIAKTYPNVSSIIAGVRSLTSLRLMNEATLHLINGRSVALYGPSGVGKTMLGKAIMQQVTESAKVYFVSADSLRKIFEQGLTLAFEQAITKGAHDRRAVVFIDEAESLLKKEANSEIHSPMASWLLTMMAGSKSGEVSQTNENDGEQAQGTLSPSFLFTFNADRSDLNERLFSPHRMGDMYSVGYVNEAQSKALVDEFTKYYGKNRVYLGDEKLNALLRPTNQGAAPMGSTTIAEIARLFVHPEESKVSFMTDEELAEHLEKIRPRAERSVKEFEHNMIEEEG